MSLLRIPLIKTAGCKNKSAARAFIIKKRSNLRLDFGVYIFPLARLRSARGLHGVTRMWHPAFGARTTRNSWRLRGSNRVSSGVARIREGQIFSQASARSMPTYRRARGPRADPARNPEVGDDLARSALQGRRMSRGNFRFGIFGSIRNPFSPLSTSAAIPLVLSPRSPGHPHPHSCIPRVQFYRSRTRV